jgi:hypothetical protein
MALPTFLWSEENDYFSFADACAPMLSGALDLKSFLLGPSQASLIFFANRSANVALSDLGDIVNELPACHCRLLSTLALFLAVTLNLCSTSSSN